MSEEDKKPGFGTYVFACLIFGLIGLGLGGPIGLVIGISIGYWSVKPKAKDKNKEIEPELNTVSLDAPEAQQIQLMSQPTKAASKPLTHYEKLAPNLLAVCIVADGVMEDHELTTAKLLLENDDYIIDKVSACEAFQTSIEALFTAYNLSISVFKLKASVIITQALNISDLHEKERLSILLDGVAESVQAGDKSKTFEMARKIKDKLNEGLPQTRQEAAENYILRSGDQEAIRLLNQIRSNPDHYSARFKEAAKSNSVLKTALGVFTGVTAANLVMGAVAQHQLKEAMTDVSAELNKLGNIGGQSLTVSEPDFGYASEVSTCMPSPVAEELSADGVDLAEIDTDGLADVDDADLGGFFSNLFS